MENKISKEQELETILPVLPLRQLTLFPGTVLSVEVGRSSSLQLLEESVKSASPRILVATQLEPHMDDPQGSDLCEVAVEAEVLKLIRLGSDRVTAVLQGIKRQKFDVCKNEPYLQAKVSPIFETEKDPVQNQVLSLQLKEEAGRWEETLFERNHTLRSVIDPIKEPGVVADVVAVSLDLPFSARMDLLVQMEVDERVSAVLSYVRHATELQKVKKRIEQQVNESLSVRQREVILRQQMKIIQDRLGESSENQEIESFAARIEDAKMPDEIRVLAQKQWRRLKEMSPSNTDYTMQRTYLEWLCDLPWSVKTEDLVDISSARKILNEDHYGLESVKKRILEYMAVRKLLPYKKGAILCLVGPPGVGKTSLGKSIAKAMGRSFVRISLGGVRDESEIRGHRRTYVGALPGRLIQAMKRAGTKNPVMLLDEIDKLGSDFRGDPSSALLEVLDPEQNETFSDHYIEQPFDLSEVIFITTANSLDAIPDPLLDRMEVIALSGYTLAEKMEIACSHLVPKQKKEHGLDVPQIVFSKAAIKKIIEHYTKEAGVRNLEREIANVCRSIAAQMVSEQSFLSEEVQAKVVQKEDVETYLGPARYFSELSEQTEQPGVCTGLAFTPFGGDLMFVEASVMKGKGQLVLTGKLGDVMKESAQAGLSWIRAHGDLLGLSADFFEKIDIHIHVPHGATPKEGPSAGVTLLLAMVSRLTGNRVRSDVAMTGEVTLRGVILPVGGIKEKVLAAHRGGIRRVILPERNRKDLVDVPKEVQDEMTFVWVNRIETVLSEGLTHPWELLGPSYPENKDHEWSTQIGQGAMRAHLPEHHPKELGPSGL